MHNAFFVVVCFCFCFVLYEVDKMAEFEGKRRRRRQTEAVIRGNPSNLTTPFPNREKKKKKIHQSIKTGWPPTKIQTATLDSTRRSAQSMWSYSSEWSQTRPRRSIHYCCNDPRLYQPGIKSTGPALWLHGTVLIDHCCDGQGNFTGKRYVRRKRSSSDTASFRQTALAQERI